MPVIIEAYNPQRYGDTPDLLKYTLKGTPGSYDMLRQIAPFRFQTLRHPLFVVVNEQSASKGSLNPDIHLMIREATRGTIIYSHAVLSQWDILEELRSYEITRWGYRDLERPLIIRMLGTLIKSIDQASHFQATPQQLV